MDHTATGPDMARAMMIEGDNLIFKQNYYDTLEEDWDDSGFQITFNRLTNKYIQWIGQDVAIFNQVITGFISLSINDVDIITQLTEEE